MKKIENACNFYGLINKSYIGGTKTSQIADYIKHNEKDAALINAQSLFYFNLKGFFSIMRDGYSRNIP